MKKIYILLGGLTEWGDGYLTSSGMFDLAARLRKLPDVSVETYPWASYDIPRRKIIIAQHAHKVALIGYSGGGSRATWLANQEPRPTIDLMVLYDPSPAWQMVPVNDNVKLVIAYENYTPLMFGLGGGRVVAKTNSQHIHISQQHLLVQFNQSLHERTFEAVRVL